MKYGILFALLFFTARGVAQSPPCDTTANCCALRCGAREDCLCDCLFANGQALRKEERYNEAVKRFEAVARLCPERNARAVIDSIYREHRVWMYQDGKFAIATPLGEPITPFQFSNPEPFRKGVAICMIGEKYYFVTGTGQVLTPLRGYDAVVPVEGGLYYLRYDQGRDGNTGHSFTNQSGIPPAFWVHNANWFDRAPFLSEFGPWKSADDLHTFLARTLGNYDTIWHSYKDRYSVTSNGLYLVKKGDARGLIDSAGFEISPPQYDYIGSFEDGLALVKKNGKWGFVNPLGQEPILAQYEDATSFAGGWAAVQKDGKWRIIDTAARNVLFLNYKDVLYLCKGGFALGSDSTGYYKVVSIDPRSKEITTLPYTFIDDLNQDLLYVSKGYTWGCIDRKGKEVVTVQYNEQPKFENGRFWVSKDSRKGILDTNGKEIIPCQYDEISDIANGRAWVRLTRKWGLIDSIGRELIPLKYENLYTPSFHEGLAVVRIDDKDGYINQDGLEIIPIQYDWAWNFKNGLAGVSKNQKSGVIDRSGHVVIPLEYDRITNFADGLAVGNNQGWHFLDTLGQQIVKPRQEYEDSKKISEHRILVKKDNHSTQQWGIIDENGRELVPPKFRILLASPDSVFWARENYDQWFLLSEDGQEFAIEKGFYMPIEEFGVVNNLPKFINGLAIIGNSWKKGLINKHGKVIADQQYEKIEPFQDGLARVQKNYKSGAIDMQGREVIPPVFNAIGPFQDSVAWAEIDGKNMLVTKSGRTIHIPDYYFRYNSMNQWNSYFKIGGPKFNNGLARVSDSHGGEWGYINEEGEKTIPLQFDLATDFSEGLAWVFSSRKWGLIDTTGQEVIAPKFDEVMAFQEGIAWVQLSSILGKWSAINISGQKIFEPEFDEVYDFQNGLARVKTANFWGIINRNGETIISPKYNSIEVFQDGLFQTKIGLKKGLIDTAGRELLVPQYSKIEDMLGAFLKVEVDGKWGILDHKGREICRPQYDEIGSLQDSFFRVRLGDKWGLLHHTGNETIPPTNAKLTTLSGTWVKQDDHWFLVFSNGDIEPAHPYDDVSEFFEGVAKVRSGNKWGFIDTIGREIIPFILDKAHTTAGKRVLIYLNGKKGMLFTDELTYISPEYDEVAQIFDEWVMVMKNNKWGWVDHRGNVMIPCRYDAATPFNEKGWATVFQFGMQFRINKKGEMIWRTGPDD